MVMKMGTSVSTCMSFGDIIFNSIVANLPEDLNAIGRQGSVGSQQGHFFVQGLSNQKTVKRVTVVEGEGGDGDAMGYFDGEPEDSDNKPGR